MEKIQRDWLTVPDKPGVYYIRCVDKSGHPCQITRLGGTDDEGIVYVGETGWNLRTRLKGFWQTAQDYRVDRHRAGWNFSYYGCAGIFPIKGLEFCYVSCKNKQQSRNLEAECLWEYRKTNGFLDLPPLNFSSGKQDF
jgi:hypothetical protein